MKLWKKLLVSLSLLSFLLLPVGFVKYRQDVKDTGSAWPYYFTETFPEEPSLKWRPGHMIIMTRSPQKVEAEAGYQFIQHYDMAGEIFLYWEKSLTFPCYTIFPWKGGYLAARMIGPLLFPQNIFKQKFISMKQAKLFCYLDYMIALGNLGIKIEIVPLEKPRIT